MDALRSATRLQFQTIDGRRYGYERTVLGDDGAVLGTLGVVSTNRERGWRKRDTLLSTFSLASAEGQVRWTAELWWLLGDRRRELRVQDPNGTALGTIAALHREKWPLMAGCVVECDGTVIGQSIGRQWWTYGTRGTLVAPNVAANNVVAQVRTRKRLVEFELPSPIADDRQWSVLTALAVAWLVDLGRPAAGG